MVAEDLTFQFFAFFSWTQRTLFKHTCKCSQHKFTSLPCRVSSAKLPAIRTFPVVTMGLNDSYRERLSIFDLTVEEVAEDYGLPLEYVIDVLISNGVEEPVYPNDVLSSRVKDSRKAEVLEALSFSDAIEIGDLYLQPTVAEIAQANGLASSQVLAFLRKEGFEAPLGPRTRIPPQHIQAVDEYIAKFLSRFRSQ